MEDARLQRFDINTDIREFRHWIYSRVVRLLLFVTAIWLIGCGPAPVAVAPAKADPATEEWYNQTADHLAAQTHDAEKLLKDGKADQAAAIITNSQPMVNRLLSAPRPTLAAMAAVSDLDQLYARMLLSNHHYGGARMLFQKNVARWKTWQPQTEDTLRRRKLAEAGIAECDQRMAE
jgi:hypothetical protein